MTYRVCENGVYRDMTTEELEQMRKDAEAYEEYERTRPFTRQEVVDMLVTEQINLLSADNKTALRMKSFYPEWEKLCEREFVAEKPDFKFQHESDLYATIKENQKFESQWIPGQGTESIYVRIDEEHAGTLEDPIPYEGNMILEEGKYYSQDAVTYKCTRGTEIAVYQALSDLIGIYVEVVEDV